MENSLRLKGIWSYLGRADKAFLAVLAAYLVSGWLDTGGLARLVLLLLVIATGVWTGLKWLRVGIRKAIWRLRNRLVVAYLFIALVPVMLIGILGLLGTWVLAGQVAVYLVQSEFDRRVSVLSRSANSMAMVPGFQRDRAWERVKDAIGDSVPGVEVAIRDRGVLRFGSEADPVAPPEGWGEASGVVLRDGLLYLWARCVQGDTDVTAIAPLSYQFLEGLAPGIGEVTILEFPDATLSPSGRVSPMRPHDIPGDTRRKAQFPARRNQLDFDFSWATSIDVALWEDPPRAEGALLSVHSRISAALGVFYRQQAEAGSMLALLYLVAVVFLLVEIAALFIGVSITRTITSAVHNLYEGTERVREGDFKHRIEVKGDDQIATVSQSFNRMTENLERLLGVAKEKERMQAELEIAREVQRQLYPKTVPALNRLELLALCNPARTVSGDYYDYQALRDSSAVVAIGDVAGKGISAALLMATLQSSLRTQVRSCLEEGSGNGASGLGLSTSRLVSQLNEQLYADTSPEKYATFLFSIYDDETGVLTYTNAGHLPPVLVRDGKASPLDVNGMVVGAFPFAQYEESQVQLEAGDLLLAFTDGITEPENEYGEMFGEERVIDLVVRNASRETGEIIKVVMDSVNEWTGSPELQDDMTMLLARRL
ncbi:MAG: PP2C family protein-serine/threonine phosphatase [bacterium]|nr:PP2C family protein-serine/threonine phosphatase [bacterium]